MIPSSPSSSPRFPILETFVVVDLYHARYYTVAHSNGKMPSVQSIVSALSFLAPLAAGQIGGVCEPLISQNNPISTKFTTQTTGTINSTIIVIPVNYTQARAVIPSQYPILTKQYQQWMPNLGDDQYPVRILHIEGY